MLDPLLLEKTKERKVLILSWPLLFWHYSVVPFLLVVPCTIVYDLIHDLLIKAKHDQFTNDLSNLSLAGLFFLVAILFFYLQRKQLRFKEYRSQADTLSFRKALEQTATALNWKVQYYSDSYIQVRSCSDWRSWEKLITIIRLPDCILLNSICDPHKPTAIASYGNNKRNVQTFINNLYRIEKNS